jgi:hypothetical protein
VVKLSEQVQKEQFALQKKQCRIAKKANPPEGIEAADNGSLFWVANCLLYHRLREHFIKKGFITASTGLWPTANLTTKNKKLIATAELRPDLRETGASLSQTELTRWQERVAQNLLLMDDITADVMDLISSAWIEQANHYEAMAVVTADDFLRFRGLKQQKNGAGRRGGYKKEWRQLIARHIDILANTWITVTAMDVTEKVVKGTRKQWRRVKWQGESRAFVITSILAQKTKKGLATYAWRVRPGDVFSKFLFKHGWQMALLSQKALAYHPIDQQWEKRLTRYFSWQWRNRQGAGAYLVPFNVETLLNAANKEVSKDNPSRTKDRLEKALDTLQRDEIISGWQYELAHEDNVGLKGWWKDWLLWKVIIEPPQEIMDQYEKIKLPGEKNDRKKHLPLIFSQ